MTDHERRWSVPPGLANLEQLFHDNANFMTMLKGAECVKLLTGPWWARRVASELPDRTPYTDRGRTDPARPDTPPADRADDEAMRYRRVQQFLGTGRARARLRRVRLPDCESLPSRGAGIERRSNGAPTWRWR